MPTKQKQAWFGPIVGTGPTKPQALAAARETAVRMLNEISTGSWPVVLLHRGHIGIAWRNLEGWSWTIVDNTACIDWPHADAHGRINYCSRGGDLSRDAAEMDMRHALALMAWQWESDDPDDIPAILIHEKTRTEWPADRKRDVRFQRAYRDAVNAGIDEGQAHTIACIASWKAA